MSKQKTNSKLYLTTFCVCEWISPNVSLWFSSFTYDDRRATNERIACMAWYTITERFMMNRFAFSIESTRTAARINAAFIDTCFRINAIRIDGAFSATSRRSTIIARQTWTDCLIIHIPAVTILAARRWITVIDNIMYYLWFCKIFYRF